MSDAMPSHGCNNDIITVNPFKSQYNCKVGFT